MTPDERHRLADLISGDNPETLGTPEEGPATTDNDPPPWHSDRSIKELIEANRAAFNERLDIKKQLQANRARFAVRNGMTTPKEGNQDG